MERQDPAQADTTRLGQARAEQQHDKPQKPGNTSKAGGVRGEENEEVQMEHTGSVTVKICRSCQRSDIGNGIPKPVWISLQDRRSMLVGAVVRLSRPGQAGGSDQRGVDVQISAGHRCGFSTAGSKSQPECSGNHDRKPP